MIRAKDIIAAESQNINFYYVPPRLRGREVDEKLKVELAEIQNAIDDKVIAENALYINVEGVLRMKNTLILCLYNSALTMDDVKYMLDVIDYYGRTM